MDPVIRVSLSLAFYDSVPHEFMARWLIHALVLLLLCTMSLVECPGCHKQLKSLSTHQKTCPDLLQALAQGPSLKRKHRHQQEVDRAKQRRVEAQRAQEQAAQDRAAAEEAARIEVRTLPNT